MIDIIVPTIPGREESLKRCVASYEKLAHGEVTTIIVENSKTCGWGWKKGLSHSTAPYVLLACDDQECVGDGWDNIAIESAKAKRIACPRVWLTNSWAESFGGDMKAFAHVNTKPLKDWSPVDYSTIPFLSRKAIDEIGMLEVHYGSDVWVSYRGRQLGYESVLRHGFEILHHQELVGRGAGMDQGDRDEMDCAVVFKELGKHEEVAV